MLKAGVIEKREYGKTYSGARQRSLISPLLAKIYLNYLDKYMKKLIKKGKPIKKGNGQIQETNKMKPTQKNKTQ